MVNESVAAMVGRYRGRVYARHAVMEAFGDPHWKQPVWKDNLLYRTFGPNYVGPWLASSTARRAEGACFKPEQQEAEYGPATTVYAATAV